MYNLIFFHNRIMVGHPSWLGIQIPMQGSALLSHGGP